MIFLIFAGAPFLWGQAPPDSPVGASGPRTGPIYYLAVTPDSPDIARDFTRAGYDVDAVYEDTFRLYATEAEKELLQNAGFSPVVLERHPGFGCVKPPTGRRGLGAYHSYDSLTSDVKSLAELHPGICRLHSLGKSVQGRDIWVLRITDNPDVEEDEPAVKYLATLHGNEPVGMEMCLYLAHHLLSQYLADDDVTTLVDHTDIWIVPLVNPDGLQQNIRFNANGYDLNRVFPEFTLGEPDSMTGREPEVIAIMAWQAGRMFTLSADFHGGALVASYPYNTDGKGSVDSPTPDDTLYRAISTEYAMRNPPMSASSTFPGGIVNGADWYFINGSMGDWNYRFRFCNEVTFEISNIKKPFESTLPGLWEDNRESMLAYLNTVHRGVRGSVTDAATGLPVRARILVEGNTQPVYSHPAGGDFYRMLLPGTYALNFDAPGYHQLRISDVLVKPDTPTRLDVALSPLPALAWFFY